MDPLVRSKRPLIAEPLLALWADPLLCLGRVSDRVRFTREDLEQSLLSEKDVGVLPLLLKDRRQELLVLRVRLQRLRHASPPYPMLATVCSADRRAPPETVRMRYAAV